MHGQLAFGYVIDISFVFGDYSQELRNRDLSLASSDGGQLPCGVCLYAWHV